MPKICEILLNLEGFQYVAPLVLNMVYYHIRFIDQASNLCTIILPWGNYKYKRLLMGIFNTPGIFREKVSKMFCGFECIRAYIDDLIITTKGDLSNHLNILELVLKKD